MNDVAYLEAARALASRMIKEGGRSAEERIALHFDWLPLATLHAAKPRFW